MQFYITAEIDPIKNHMSIINYRLEIYNLVFKKSSTKIVIPFSFWVTLRLHSTSYNNLFLCTIFKFSWGYE